MVALGIMGILRLKWRTTMDAFQVFQRQHIQQRKSVSLGRVTQSRTKFAAGLQAKKRAVNAVHFMLSKAPTA
jgi:hypothetical protein